MADEVMRCYLNDRVHTSGHKKCLHKLKVMMQVSVIFSCLLLVLALRSARAAGAAGLIKQLSSSIDEGPILPWLQPDSWKPTYSALYNDLPGILKLRASRQRWVTVFCFSIKSNRTGSAEDASFVRLALNAIATYRMFGEASADIVAAVGPEALEECQKFRLPCYNATSYSSGSRSYKDVVWAKIRLVRDILQQDYNVHMSDLDLSYLKPIHLAMNEVFSWSRGVADGSMMQEEWVYQDNPKDSATRRPIYMGNTGVVFLRANKRTVGFLDSLLKWAGERNQDQYMVTIVAFESWAPCDNEASCLAARNRGLAAITLHPTQFVDSNCMPERGFSVCDPRRLYIHTVCRASSASKEGFLRFNKAMFIRDLGLGSDGKGAAGKSVGRNVSTAGVAAVAVAALGDPLVVGQLDAPTVAASGLPCPLEQQRAWRDGSRSGVEGDADETEREGAGGRGGGGKAGATKQRRLRGS